MIGFDAGFIPQLLCVADTSPGGVSGALCVLVVSLAVGAGFWQAADPRRKAVGRFMVIGAWTGLAAHAVVAATVRLS
ncbi:hypothetical protein Acy02nite_15740 [Actinoplanes cyaneus]|uniref:Uncharacterized protein n=2 Tax=Actinoplanes cyaneus TaxID=52696 RepID=A0A919IDR2_9ACTN|nr:hypothetical protein [Actinoplanes cyaneus]GID63693.1 hypothetical protein Acy02nite_15740 [Actinoplanes cyaneus]